LHAASGADRKRSSELPDAQLGTCPQVGAEERTKRLGLFANLFGVGVSRPRGVPLNSHFKERDMTTNIEVAKIEEQAKGGLLFNVRTETAEGRIEFPIEIQELGSPDLDEAAVLRSTLDFAQQLTASIRLRLAPQTPELSITSPDIPEARQTSRPHLKLAVGKHVRPVWRFPEIWADR
jgi:hypothetical protein